VTITAAPQSLTVAELQTVTLTVTASGSAPLTYQWQRSADGASWTDVAGATADSYTTPQLVRTDSGVRYRVIVNNAANQPAASAPAQLTVTADAAVLLGSGCRLLPACWPDRPGSLSRRAQRSTDCRRATRWCRERPTTSRGAAPASWRRAR
jgi:hypothetical protein